MTSLGYLFLKKCDNCECREERVFTDSWTGVDICGSCLYAVLGKTSLSPATEGDNLYELLIAAYPYSNLAVRETD